MCGLAGFLGGMGADGASGEEALLRRMATGIARRGPDDSGYWCDVAHRIGLGHRRLAIVDLTAAGHQPMRSADGRYVIVFNGEIYNHMDLRQELEQCGVRSAWRGHSDTETLLAGFGAWGIKGTIERVNGMLALAVWDRQTHTLTLARDRFGEKPLYYGWQGQGAGRVFLFGSELKALRAHPGFCSGIDRGALSLLLRYNSIPAPYSIYQGIAKLLPGTLLTVSMAQPEPNLTSYWSSAQVAVAGVANRFKGGGEQAIDALEGLLKDAVQKQMMADVPLGAFLSGGVDSSTVVALMQAQSARPIKTFTIGFQEPGYNEAEHAKAVASYLGTDHSELYLTAEQAMAVIPLLSSLYDEPFSDSSQIPTFLVSHLARQQVTVALSGDAGDELFCGYNRYQVTAKLWHRLSAVPLLLRKFAAKALMKVSPAGWDRLASAAYGLLPNSLKFSNMGEKIHKGAGVLASQSVDALYLGLVSQWDDPASVVIGGFEPPTLLTGHAPVLEGLDEVERMMALDLLTYLPDDILTKVDRAAMGVSLESRMPFLDHRVVEFAWRLPQDLKLRDGQTKWALRQVLYRHVPQALIERPKMGFGVPIDSWLRGALRPWVEALLDESRLRREGYFHPAPIRLKWQQHLSGQRNWQHQLWGVLMFQAWLESQNAGSQDV